MYVRVGAASPFRSVTLQANSISGLDLTPQLKGCEQNAGFATVSFLSTVDIP